VERVRIGIVGAGLIAQIAHLPQLAELADRFTVAAVADPRRGVREAVARRHGIAAAFPDLGELLAGERVDALLVCTPSEMHAPMTLEALAAGVHVLVEKPLCETVQDADRIAAARDRAGVVVQVGYMKRFDPAYEALLAELEGAPPELLHIAGATYDPGLAAAFGHDAPPGPVDVRSDVFLGALIHDVNLVHGILDRLGMPYPGRVVDAFATADGAAAGGTVALHDGIRWSQVWLHVDGLGDFREHLVLYGARDLRELEFPAPYLAHAPTAYRRSAEENGGNVTRTFRSWREAYRRQLEHFHGCIVDGAPCRTPPEQARADIALLTAMHGLVA
jgi:predicted dehydrogenase